MSDRRGVPSASPLRIALIAPLVAPIAEPQVGGSQVVVSDLARGLAARGHDVTLYAAEGSRVDSVKVTSLGIEAGAFAPDTYRHDAPVRASDRLVEAYGTLYAHVREQQFDVVHNHGFDAPAIAEAVRARIPVVHTVHLPPSDAIANAINEARESGVATWTFGVSASHTASWRRRVVMDGALANGVPVDDIPYRDAAPRVALIASRFSPEKGMAEGIGVARRAGWPVVVYGTAYDAAYEHAVRDRWCDDLDVQFHPAAVRSALWDALAGAGVVLCLFRWDEPFGMVAAEAQAAGTPVVATRRGALLETIRDGETGVLVDLDDIEGAVAALDDVGKLDRSGCRAHALEHLSLSASIARHEGVYARVAALARTTA
jgi:UDP-glucose:tetrahydrobiopterin glucosyltransferase